MGKFFSSMFTFIIAKVVNMVFTPCSVIGLPAYQGYRMLEVLWWKKFDCDIYLTEVLCPLKIGWIMAYSMFGLLNLGY
jgi:hypothetical protein